VKEAIGEIHRKHYLLPAIQRELVWTPEQIIRLFDSLMRGYTIGSFLFWAVDKDKIGDFQWYEFLRNYHERDSKHNPKASATGEDSVTAILDGQQRLTALYIGLRGTYAYKMPWKRQDSVDAYPSRKLYLNLLDKSDQFDLFYDLKFLTPTEASVRNEKTHWFEAGKALDFSDLRDINDYLRTEGLIENKFCEECLFGLYENLTQKAIINYYQETSQELDKVLNIFIRVNSGGTPLSYSDLLLSIATAQWKTMDAREEITAFVDGLNRIGEGFQFDKDFVLKSCLVLADIADIAFKVDNFNMANMKTIEDHWEETAKAIQLAVELVSSFGYNSKSLTSTNALIPIAYYIDKLGSPESFVQSLDYVNDRKRVRKWLTASLIRRSFSGQPDDILRPVRNILRESRGGFPLERIVDEFKGKPLSITFSEEDLQNLLDAKYGERYTFSILSLLYPTLDFRNRFHMDHIFPRSFFKKRELRKKGIPEDKRDFFLENYDRIGNLQMLEGLPNEEKSSTDFEQWLARAYGDQHERTEYMKKHYIPRSVDLGFHNFEEFFNTRRELMLEEFRKVLSYSESFA
jgi:uncharacterized protein with ParB-like and HNH nuclease domain